MESLSWTLPSTPSWHLGYSNHELSLLALFFGLIQLVFPPKWCHVDLASICHFLDLYGHYMGLIYGSHPIRLLYLSISRWATSSLARRPDIFLKVTLSMGTVLLYRCSVFQEEKRAGKKAFYGFYFDAASSASSQFGNCIIRGADTSYNGTGCLCKLPGTESTCKRVGACCENPIPPIILDYSSSSTGSNHCILPTRNLPFLLAANTFGPVAELVTFGEQHVRPV